MKFRPVDVTFGLDNLDRRALYNVDIDPDNACPIADLNGPYNGNEGQAIQISGASSFDLEEANLIYRLAEAGPSPIRRNGMLIPT